ncbi:MAG: tetratricopeptide repeat protein [Roseomonas sp.]|nr:tetratricopeptide repeat protein [Roseomonas sp.]MCA3288803.1 tetratricopeptide repeat protein [Roseomonas sp.]MCA3294979.1 tetratricopeptide repeat protein [Roseomonas sp.]MCA3342853.1 tetratricopeptide repeat protein [Roseomonas sp.]
MSTSAATPDAEALLNEAMARLQARDFRAAAPLFQRAIALGSDAPEIRNNLGQTLRFSGDRAGAVAAFREALRQRPAYGRAAANLVGILLPAQADAAQAVVAAALAAGAGEGLHRAVAGLWRDAGRPDRAMFHLRALLETSPGDTLMRSELGTTLMGLGRPSAAIPHLARVAEEMPDRADAKVNHGLALQQAGDIGGAMAVQRRAIAQDPGCRPAWQNLLLGLNYVPGITAAEVAATHRAYAQRFARPAPAPFANTPDPDRRLRIGMLSGDFRQHPVGYFLEAAIAQHQRAGFHLTAYDVGKRADATTARLRGLFDHWHSLGSLDDAAIVAQLRADGIDILVDLTGHTETSRIGVMEYRPAPVQVSWIGYANTNGVAAMDWIIADDVVLPPEDEALYIEKPLRLPGCYLCYTPGREAVAPSPPPMLRQGHVTFGCFNNLAKLNDEVLAAWAAILARLPDARLLLKTAVLREAATAQRLRALFAAAGGDVARLDLEGHSPRADYFARYATVDFMLDPFPFPGGTTTVEAIHAGVPTLTRRGRGGMISRNGETLLSAVGLQGWIAADTAEYIEKAIAFAQDADGLAAIRARLSLGPLGDAATYARGLEAGWRRIWRDWCARQGR